MFVYLVIFGIPYEGENVIGVFSDIVKARQFDLEYCQKNNVNGKYEWTEIRKVEVDKVYEDIFGGIGEEV